MKFGDRLIGQLGKFRVTLERGGEDILVTLCDTAAQKVLGTDTAAIEEAFQQAKEKAVVLIGRELNALTHEEFDRIRTNITWRIP